MNYLIYGLGKSGISAANYLSKNNNVIVTDDSEKSIINAKNLLNSNIKSIEPTKINYSQINKVIFAPGIPLFFPQKHQILAKQKEYNFELICDIEEFYQLNINNNFIGITGTNGKSTLTSLVGHIFKDLNIKSDIGGNIGIPSFELKTNNKQTYIFENSSYQLDLTHKLRFNIACLLNITPDHLERHGNMQNYISSKSRIFNNQQQDDFSIINYDNKYCQEIHNNHLKHQNSNIIKFSTQETLDTGLSYINNIINIKTNFYSNNVKFEAEFLKGQHNKENIIAAIAITISYLNQHNLEIDLTKILDSINKYKGLKHRQELVRTINNINFINDSKATNSESTKTALNSFKNIYLILGGKQKDNLEAIIPLLKEVKKIYLIGEAQENFAKILSKNLIDFEKNKQLNIAINNAFYDAKNCQDLNQKNILFSPACSSFDQFSNFEERGNYYCKLVNEL